MQLAVTNEWGGPDSVEIYEWFIETTIKKFSEMGQKIDLDDLLDLFSHVLDAEFQMIADDGSIDAVANTLLKLFNECIRGRTDLLDKLRSLHPTPVQPTLDSSDESNNDENSNDESNSDESNSDEVEMKDN